MPRRFTWSWRKRPEIERDVDEEIAFHLEMRVAELVATGVPPSIARAQAVRELGDVVVLRRWLHRIDERIERRRKWWAWLSDVRQDVRHAVRMLARSPAFTMVALATLSLGIGAAVAVFAVVYGVVLRPLPYADADRLVLVSPGQNFNMALADAVLAGAPSIADGTGISHFGLTLTGAGDAVEVNAQFVDAAFFDVFHVRPALGRAFRPDERDPARSGVVILSHALWQSRFGGDRAVIGRLIDLDGSGWSRREVIGIMPAGFRAPLDEPGKTVDVWAPLSRAAERTIATDSTWYVNAVVGRLAPGGSVERAAEEVRSAMARIRADVGNIIGEERIRTAGAVGLLDSMVGGVRHALWTLLAAVGLILLLVCANLTNLLLARGDARRQELAVRAALGAGRGRLVRAQLTESGVLALLGGAGGVAAAHVILRVVGIAQASGLPRTADLAIDLRVLAFALAVSAVCVLGFGLLPALRASGTGLQETVGAGARARGPGRAGRGLRFALIAGEVALAMVLVTGAGLLLHSLRILRAVDPGLDTRDVLALELAPPAVKYGGERARIFYDRVLERLGTLPGVRAAGGIQLLPFTDNNWSFPYLAEGHAPPRDGPLPSTNFRIVTPGYFDATDIPVLAGRVPDATDRTGGPAVGVINRALAARLWPGEHAVGRTIKLFGNQPIVVVGVVGDVRQASLDVPTEPEIYIPLAQWPWTVSMVVMIEADVDPASLVAPAQAAVWEIGPDVPVRAARPLGDVLDASMRQRRFFADVLTFFGVLALVLGAVGVYGVMAYSMGARRGELGVRLALGATSRRVVGFALLSGLAPVMIGLAVGAAGALATTHLLESLLFGLQARDPTTLAVAAVVLGAVATAAIWLPVRSVGRIDVTGVLKGE